MPWAIHYSRGSLAAVLVCIAGKSLHTSLLDCRHAHLNALCLKPPDRSNAALVLRQLTSSVALISIMCFGSASTACAFAIATRRVLVCQPFGQNIHSVFVASAILWHFYSCPTGTNSFIMLVRSICDGFRYVSTAATEGQTLKKNRPLADNRPVGPFSTYFLCGILAMRQQCLNWLILLRRITNIIIAWVSLLAARVTSEQANVTSNIIVYKEFHVLATFLSICLMELHFISRQGVTCSLILL